MSKYIKDVRPEYREKILVGAKRFMDVFNLEWQECKDVYDYYCLIVSCFAFEELAKNEYKQEFILDETNESPDVYIDVLKKLGEELGQDFLKKINNDTMN